MSDYWSDDPLPLFSISKAIEKPSARDYHERTERQIKALNVLRSGEQIFQADYDHMNGGRVAASIGKLRACYGFVINGDGSKLSPYEMLDTSQHPRFAAVTDEMKAAYYMTPWWNAVRSRRLEIDGRVCVLCRCSDKPLLCHHVTYERLFAEEISDLLTVCDPCHEKIHVSCRLKFPSGVATTYAHLLGWKGQEEWLMP